MAPAPSSPQSSGRLSPVVPLAPLEYLQNQRRGSITDPSLHAAKHTISNQLFRPQEHSAGSLTQQDSLDRPSSPYVFGDATSDNNPPLRNLLRSPSFDNDNLRSSASNLKPNESAPRNISTISENSPLEGAYVLFVTFTTYASIFSCLKIQRH